MTSEKTDPKLKDIAEAAGVSVAAVSRVLNNRGGVGEETRQRVLRLMAELGYRGRSGRTAPGMNIGLVTLENYVTNDSFYGEVLSAISLYGQQIGMKIRLRLFRNAAQIPEAEDLGADDDGLFLVGVDHPSTLAAINNTGKPVVILNGMDPSMQLASVTPDYLFGGRMATDHLLDLGHSDIVHVTHPYRESVRRRIYGFRSAMEERGLSFDAAYHLLDLGHPRNLSMAAQDVIQSALEARDRIPTALFCVTDMVAFAATQALRNLGLRVPEDVSVVGFDGLPMGEFATPPLTSISTDRTLLGRTGVQMLADRIAQPDAPVQSIVLGTKLTLRQSTAQPRD